MAVLTVQVIRENYCRAPASHVATRCLLLVVLCLSACGCRGTSDAEKERQASAQRAKIEEKPKEPFEARQPTVMPAGIVTGSCKPGHWISQVWPDVKANLGNFQGELQTAVEDDAGHALQLPAVACELTNLRPATLAKEQAKSLECMTWIPPQENARLESFKLAAGGRAMIERSMLLARMPSYRYFFIVLSKSAGRYEYLDKKLASIRERRSQADGEPDLEQYKYYEVVSMPASKRPSLPANALCWTSIAYLLWDDFDPALCDADQQRALVDWLHWGGQIIVSGPDALEQLHNSFLRPFLPAAAGRSRNLSADDLSELQYWSGELSRPPQPVRPWQGAELTLDASARYLPYTGDLVAERQVGRGRVVASAFRLAGPELTGWSGFDCFFNACLLRRPARLFPGDQDPSDAPFHWADGSASSPPLDAAKMTSLRFFVRDAGVEFRHYAADLLKDKRAAEASFNGDTSRSATADENSTEAGSGLAAWNDFSPVAEEARAALGKASSIKVPDRSFILWMVLGYLCVLVPVNWLVFRLLGRVEWAWIAAPAIAVACTVVVIQQAQLNIGFARSQNEIVVIELQSGYPRAHVAHYTSLYTSLATRYEIRMSDPGGQILPFPGAKTVEKPLFQTIGELVCRRDDDAELTGFNVASNAYDFVHSEEMADFGTVKLIHDGDGTLRIVNGTAHPLVDCQVIRGKTDGTDRAKRIDRLEPGAIAVLTFDAAQNKTATLPQFDHAAGNESGTGAEPGRRQNSEPTGELKVDGLTEVALHRQEIRPGEVCLVAGVDGLVPGLSIAPLARQSRQAAILVAHLDPGKLPEPKADSKSSLPSSQGGKSL
jgi:hypothetical protein